MTKEQKVKKAQQLRAQGLTHREIGERMGVTHSAVVKWLNPDATREYNRRDLERPGRHDAKLAEGRKPGGVCRLCGGPISCNSVRGGHTRCQECRQAEAERKREQIIEGYRAGLTAWQISEQTGIPHHSVTVEACRLRSQGVDLAHCELTGGAAHRKKLAAA